MSKPKEKKRKQKKPPIGVVIARFQIDELHPGQKHLITHVRQRHEDVLIVLGIRGGVRSAHNQLRFEERKVMVEQSFPEQHFTIVPHGDHPYDSEIWSKKLDVLIEKTFPGRKAILYGGRKSFRSSYTGKFPTKKVRTIFPDSGTLARKALEFPNTRDGRAAILYEMEHRPPFMYSTADLAIVDWGKKRVLLIGKNCHDGKLSFAGGHAEKGDGSAIETARREGREEILGIGLGPLEYVSTICIDDPRYKGTHDGVMTTFFMAQYLGGEPSPGDDADYVEWVSFKKLVSLLTPWHQPLGKLLLEKLTSRK